LQVLREQDTNRIVNARTLEAIRQALSSGSCTLCEVPLAGSTKDRLEQRLAELSARSTGDGHQGQIHELENRIAQLRKYQADSSGAGLQEVSAIIDDLRVSKATTEDELRDVKEQTQGLDESELRRIYGEYEKAVQEIAIVERGIREQDEALAKINSDI